MDFSTIGEKLKYLRLNNSLTQEEVGKKINVSKQTLYKYENGIITNIPSDKIEILAEIYHVSPAYLMGWENTSSVPNLVEIIRNDSYTLAGRTPTPADRAYLSDMVDTYIDESADQTIAAHRTDSPSADLPEEALQSIEEFKNFVRAKYKKD
ncbi:Helix-turn-helix domain-containing protein [Propionispira arboris]|uniref:Helix-turn-helix domain-containing protein n=1 Tax=Propionispira arboris TaxID=84035 RepID=A0A1H6Y6Z1_9FIRM|nr:helix-turn-helix transcriptional regulator [Propionispira arboris]SEJ36236.1 Helix-turn-helix domain-containing protein [Propionispira arboris]